MLYQRFLDFTTQEEGEANLAELRENQQKMVGQHMKDLVQIDIDKVQEKLDYIVTGQIMLLQDENTPQS